MQQQQLVAVSIPIWSMQVCRKDSGEAEMVMNLLLPGAVLALCCCVRSWCRKDRQRWCELWRRMISSEATHSRNACCCHLAPTIPMSALLSANDSGCFKEHCSKDDSMCSSVVQNLGVDAVMLLPVPSPLTEPLLALLLLLLLGLLGDWSEKQGSSVHEQGREGLERAHGLLCCECWCDGAQTHHTLDNLHRGCAEELLVAAG